jgi:hypothetical protein
LLVIIDLFTNAFIPISEQFFLNLDFYLEFNL